MKPTQKVIVVTGAAGLLGSEFVKAISAGGNIAVAADIDISKVKDKNADPLLMDITSESSVKKAIASLHKKYGKIDALVNNAYPRNKNYGKKFEDVSYSDFSENVSMHLGGYFLCSKLFADYFKKQGSGNIISMASIYGVNAPRFDIYEGTDKTMPVEYAAIKAGVIHLTRYMARYFQGSGIRFNSISPGGTFNNEPKEFVKNYSGYSPAGRMVPKEGIVSALLFLLSDGSSAINGQNIIVDDGWTL